MGGRTEDITDEVLLSLDLPLPFPFVFFLLLATAVLLAMSQVDLTPEQYEALVAQKLNEMYVLFSLRMCISEVGTRLC